jgi:hypothetical protein
MNNQKRNLAFYKRSGEPWTYEECENIVRYVGSKVQIRNEDWGNIDPCRKFMFDSCFGRSFMASWSDQEDHNNFKNCKQVAYEDVFLAQIERVDEQFTKADQSKNRLELIEPEFIKGLGRIVSFGAAKYSAENWKKAEPEDIDRIKGALLRHIMDYLSGDNIDPETNESHLYHAACNLMFLDYFDRVGDQEQ